MARHAAIAIVVVLAVSLMAGAAVAQTYKIEWYTIGSGGGEMSGSTYKLNGTVGQPVAGYVESVDLKHWIGFWVGGEDQTPVVVPLIKDAKLLPDGTYVSVAGKVATSGTGDFTGFFYLEETDRSSGIRIEAPSWPASLVEGSVVNVVGTLGTTAAGERCITAPMVVVTSTQTPLKPLGMTNLSVGGGDFGSPPLGQLGVLNGTGLNNIGLLIKTWGKVVETGPGYAVLDDGSTVGGVPVRIRLDTSTLATPVTTDQYISVIGISSRRTGQLPIVLPRADSDVQQH